MSALLIVLGLGLGTAPARAGEADVLDVTAGLSTDGTYSFAATVRHADTGWDHYADAFEILSPDGEILAVRKLAHPHENEQPFTRSIGGVKIPAGLSEVVLRAHDSVHGYGGTAFNLALPGR